MNFVVCSFFFFRFSFRFVSFGILLRFLFRVAFLFLRILVTKKTVVRT